MEIKTLFDKLCDEKYLEKLKGELTLLEDTIVWTYNLINDSEEYDSYESIDEEENEQDEDLEFDALSSEELLTETYDEEVEMIEEFIDEIDNYANWSFSNPEIKENIISFKIY